MSNKLPEKAAQANRLKENTLENMIGDVTKLESLSEDLRDHPGLIWFTTSDGLDLVPIKQFVLDESGEQQLIPPVADGYALICSLESQRNTDKWQLLLMFMQYPSNGEASFFDKLADPSIDTTAKLDAVAKKVDYILYSAAFEGSEIRDPRLLLPGADE